MTTEELAAIRERDEIAAAAGKAAYERDQLQTRLDKVRELHQERRVYGCEDTCEYEDDERHCETTHFESADGEWLCADLYEYSVCSHCRDEEGLLTEDYPCPTIQALNGSDQ